MLALTTVGVTEQAGSDARQKLSLGQAVLHQARMDVDRARERNALDRELLLVHAVRREPREQRADQCKQTYDEAQPNHSLTLT